MTHARFYAPGIHPGGDRVVLPADESHHLARVLRLTAGDEVAAFDGRGGEFLARVERADREAAVLRILRTIDRAPDPTTDLVLVQAGLKGDKMDGVVRDTTMAGVARIAPVATERSIVPLRALTRAHAAGKWQRVAISSAKQCGRARLPVIEPPLSFEDWLRSPFEGIRLLLVEPSATERAAVRLRDALDGTAPRSVACIVGPEGGWSPTEREAAASAGCAIVTLGPMTLRADAAGLVAVSIVSFVLGENERRGR
jgi:16S rRNA (uracil1498-N3)-methyltransferase